MTKLIATLIGVVFFFSACTKDDVESISTMQTRNLNNRFYGVRLPDTQTKSTAQRDKLWYNGTTIKVKFLNDPFNLAEKVKTYAKVWEEYANIKFDFIESGDAHIRVGFDWNDVRSITWSYIGTDCKMNTNQNDATMSFAYFDELDEADMKGDVLRTFGQALGLELEHRHLNFDPGWTNRIAQYWEGEIGDIPWADLKKYVFDPLAIENTIETEEYDENSIMIWPFMRKYASNTARDYNNELSAQDIEFIQLVYPKNIEKVLLLVAESKGNNVYFAVNLEANLTFNWGGEGVLTRSVVENKLAYHFVYTNPDSHTVKIYGNSLTNLYCGGEAIPDIKVQSSDLESLGLRRSIGLSNLDISSCPKLKSLDCPENLLTELDLSNNFELIGFDCSKNQLTNLDITNNVNLSAFSCAENQLTNLDISQNPLLALNCNNNQLTSLDLSANVDLSSLNCSNNQLTKLIFANGQRISNLDCSNNQLSSINLSAVFLSSTFKCNDNQLTQLDLSNSTELWGVWCYNNPIITNNEELVRLANSLVDRTTLPYRHGELYIKNPESKEWIKAICDTRRWSVY